MSLSEVAQSTQTLLSTQTNAYASIKQKLFAGVSSLTWNPGSSSSYFNILDGARNQVVLPSNWMYDSNKAGTAVTLAVVGTDPTSKSLYAAFGGDPIVVNNSAAMSKLVANTVGWLTSKSTAPASFKIVIAYTWHSYEDDQWAWFRSQYPGITINGVNSTGQQQNDICDGTALDGCLQSADLLVIGREPDPSHSIKPYDGNVVMQAVKSAQSRGIPILYLDDDYPTNDLQSRLLSYFGLSPGDNYWDENGLNNFNPSTLPAVPAQLAGYSELINHLVNGDFSTTWNGCTGGRGCDEAVYKSEFGDLAGQIRNTFRQMDASGTVIFGQPGYDLEKRLALLGDKYRELVAYPLDKVNNQQDFIRALFSDVTAYVHRGYSAVATNLGSFAKLIPSSTPTTSQTMNVALPTTGRNEDYVTELYVMPGRTVTLKRSDSSASTVTFGLNMLRNTTSPFDTNGLDRPTQISSPSMPLATGQSVSITSPYGGPLYLTVSPASGAVQTVTVKIDGATTYPLLRDGTDPTQVANFKAAVANTPTSWVGVVTELLTVFSTMDRFKSGPSPSDSDSTLNDYNNDVTRLVSDIRVYTVKDSYELAGYNSTKTQLTLAPRVTAFCDAKGWDCTGTQHRKDGMQYFIADRSLCGSGCSGNPIDYSNPFWPLGWGTSHEIGHNNQPGRLKIYGGQSTEVSNNIFPMHKRQHYNVANNNQPAPGFDSPFADGGGEAQGAFNALKGALGQQAPNDAKTVIWYNSGQGLVFYRQLVEYARYYNSGSGNSFNDGWELYSLLYLLDRNFGNTSDTNWPSVAASYGFSTYSTKPSIDGNDFMLIATSWIIGKDMRAAFDLWGITYTQAASDQVAAHGHASAGALLFPMNNRESTGAGVGAPITVDSNAEYPPGY